MKNNETLEIIAINGEPIGPIGYSAVVVRKGERWFLEGGRNIEERYDPGRIAELEQDKLLTCLTQPLSSQFLEGMPNPRILYFNPSGFQEVQVEIPDKLADHPHRCTLKGYETYTALVEDKEKIFKEIYPEFFSSAERELRKLIKSGEQEDLEKKKKLVSIIIRVVHNTETAKKEIGYCGIVYGIGSEGFKNYLARMSRVNHPLYPEISANPEDWRDYAAQLTKDES